MSGAKFIGKEWKRSQSKAKYEVEVMFYAPWMFVCLFIYLFYRTLKHDSTLTKKDSSRSIANKAQEFPAAMTSWTGKKKKTHYLKNPRKEKILQKDKKK